ncbi:MAG: HAMP domain-containing sensor histidine kinase [Chloroflexota bacterium]
MTGVAPDSGPSSAPPSRQELDRLEEKLHQLEQLKRNFTMLAAHELRNPLAILLGYAKILEDESSGNTREYASIVVSRAQQLKSIVDSLVVLQQSDAGELALHPSTFLIAESIQQVIAEQHPYSQLKALQIELCGELGLYVRADRERVTLALTNVLLNAIKYSAHGGQITIETRADVNNVVVSIHDKGIGIPPADQSHIFDRFYHVSNSLPRENGLGIGLAVAKAIVELHHGRIWVESAPNQGSTFSLSLRRAYPLNANAAFQRSAAIMTAQ